MDRRQLHAKALSYITMNAVVKTVNIGQAHHMLNDSWIYESTIFFSKNFYVLFFYKVEIFYSGPPEHGEDWSFTNGPFSLLRPLQLTLNLPMLFIIQTLMLLKDPTHWEGFQEFQLLLQIRLCYCVFLHHEADKLDPNA